MPVFVVLLRAVNVGGTGKLPMGDLKRLCEKAGFRNVRTYIASGNVIVAQHDDTDFGWNAGLGVAFRLRGTPQMFIEARYTEIETTPQKFQYVPITFGVRF